MTTPMIEKMQIAAMTSMVSAGLPTDVGEFLVQGDPRRGVAPGLLRNALRAALLALADPDEGMVEAGTDAVNVYGSFDRGTIGPTDAAKAFRAMILNAAGREG
jgi:hypothetical protein